MINNKIIINELNDLEKELEDLCLRIKELKDEVHKLVKPRTIIHEQHITRFKNVKDRCNRYYYKSRYNENTKVVNICGPIISSLNYNYGCFHKNTNDNDYIIVEDETRTIIETYIPSKNLLMVVEL